MINVSLTQLEYLTAVDTYRNFNQAARHCMVTQPTLSMQIQKAKESLGVIIFDRSKSPVVPTPLGEKIIEQARLILRESSLLGEIASAGNQQIAGDLRIGIIPTVGPYLIPRFLKSFVISHPSVTLQVNELQTDAILELIQKDQLDAGVLATPVERPGVFELPLYYEPFNAFLPDDHPLIGRPFLAPDDLNLSDLLLLEEGHCFRNQALQICAHDVVHEKPQATFISGSLDMLRRLAEQGFGVTLLPQLMVLSWDQKPVNLKQFGEPAPTREISLVYSRTYLKRAIMDALADAIRASVPREMLKKSGSVLKPLMGAGS